MKATNAITLGTALYLALKLHRTRLLKHGRFGSNYCFQKLWRQAKRLTALSLACRNDLAA